MEKKNRNQRGITLLALVITIVILLILAGVGIGSITGEKRTIQEAGNAKELAEKAALEEQIEAAILIAEQKHRNPTLDDVIDEIKNSKIITNHEQVDRETGKIKTDLGYVIEGKLSDYLGNISSGGENNKVQCTKCLGTGSITAEVEEECSTCTGTGICKNKICVNQGKSGTYYRYECQECGYSFVSTVNATKVSSEHSKQCGKCGGSGKIVSEKTSECDVCEGKGYIME